MCTTAHSPTFFCEQFCSQQLFAMSCACTQLPGSLWHRTLPIPPALHVVAASCDYRTSAQNTQYCHMHSYHTQKYSRHIKYSKVKLYCLCRCMNIEQPLNYEAFQWSHDTQTFTSAVDSVKKPMHTYHWFNSAFSITFLTSLLIISSHYNCPSHGENSIYTCEY